MANNLRTGQPYVTVGKPKKPRRRPGLLPGKPNLGGRPTYGGPKNGRPVMPIRGGPSSGRPLAAVRGQVALNSNVNNARQNLAASGGSRPASNSAVQGAVGNAIRGINVRSGVGDAIRNVTTRGRGRRPLPLPRGYRSPGGDPRDTGRPSETAKYL